MAPQHLTSVLNTATTAQQLVFHYTTGERFEQITRTGAILPATRYVPLTERPAVWFSRHPYFEPTARKGCALTGRTLTMEETAVQGRGLVRLGVSLAVARYPWKKFLKKSGIDRATARRLADSAKVLGANPQDWFVSFAPVGMQDWRAVDVWHEGEWVPVELPPLLGA